MSRSEKVSYILSSIHYADFPGIFNAADVAQLQQALTSHPPSVSYYDLLNVLNDAQSGTAAKEKRDLLALRFHPDKTVDKPDREARAEIFKLIQAAYETINDPRAKQDYDARLRRAPKNAAADDREKQSRMMRLSLKNNESTRKKVLEDPAVLLTFAREQRWGYVHQILLMFLDMIDCDHARSYSRTFPGPGSRDNPFYIPGREQTPTAALTAEFTNKFREPIIFLLKKSVRNPAAGIFLVTFAVLQANPHWPSVEILLHPDHREILNRVIDNLECDCFRRDFQAIFKKAADIEQLLRIVDQAQRKTICEECVEHIRIAFLFKEHEHFRQMDLSLFPQFIIDNFSVVLAEKATNEYYTEKQTAACCCSSFFFSWKSAGSKTIFYALKEISDQCYFLYYGDTAHQLYHSGYNLLNGQPCHDENHRRDVMTSSKHAYELVFKTLLNHASEIGTHLYAILRKYQLIDEDKKPSQKLFSALRAKENAKRMNPLNV